MWPFNPAPPDPVPTHIYAPGVQEAIDSYERWGPFLEMHGCLREARLMEKEMRRKQRYGRYVLLDNPSLLPFGPLNV